MSNKARQNSVTDNESNNDGSCILFKALGLVRTAKIVLRGLLYGCLSAAQKIKGSPLFCGFCALSGFEECKTMPPTHNAVIKNLFCAASNEMYGRLDHICIFGVEEIYNEGLFERAVEVANDNGVTISKQDISVCHRLPSRNPGSWPRIAKFVRRETKFRVIIQKKNFEKLIQKSFLTTL